MDQLDELGDELADHLYNQVVESVAAAWDAAVDGDRAETTQRLATAREAWMLHSAGRDMTAGEKMQTAVFHGLLVAPKIVVRFTSASARKQHRP